MTTDTGTGNGTSRRGDRRRLTVELSAEVYAQLLRLAEVGGVTMADLIHQAALSFHRRRPHPRVRRRR